MTSILVPGSVIRCVSVCTLVEDVNAQVKLPYPGVLGVVFCYPGDVGLLVDVKGDAAFVLMGNKVFLLDLHRYEFDRYFELVNAI